MSEEKVDLESLTPEQTAAVEEQVRERIEKEVEERVARETIEGLMSKVYDIEESMEDLKMEMAKEDHTPFEIPHPTKAAIGKTKMVIKYKAWSKEGQKAKKEYEELERKHTKLLETSLIGTLRNTPWDHFDFINGSVNGDGWILYLGNKSADGKSTLRGVFKLKHYMSTIKDSMGNEQCGVYTHRKERDTKTNEWTMSPYVKPVIIDARPAKPGEVEKAKEYGKRDYARLKAELRGKRSQV